MALLYLFLWQLIKPYGAGSTPGQNDCPDEKSHVKLQGIMEKAQIGIRGPGLRCISPDYDTKEIKNIYVDCKLISFPVNFFYNCFYSNLVLPSLFLTFIFP